MEEREEFADIIIDISHERLDHPFTYRVPEALRGRLSPGDRVRIPFGRGNTERFGYCIELKSECGYPASGIKEILSVCEDGGNAPDGAGARDPRETALRLALWMKETYGSTAITALKTVLPIRRAARPEERRRVCLLLSRKEAGQALELCRKKHQTARARLLEGLLLSPEQPYSLLVSRLHLTAAVIRAAEKAGLIQIETERSLRNPVRGMEAARTAEVLSAGQQAAADGVLADLDAGKTTVSLLHGITGSGKTEVYIRIIEGAVARGRQAIMLIPEIALSYQTLLRFYGHFGDRVTVMNSTLSDGEKYDQFERARRGEVDVVIGPRSALFTPFPNLGVIVLDEEHAGSYKNETMPKYHARETAIRLAGLCGACVVLGSATPSMESRYQAECGSYRMYRLGERLTGGSLPAVRIADMRRELAQGNRTIFSEELQSLMEDRLRRNEQIMLFLNRRGVVGSVSCRACGHVLLCPHCAVSLTEHGRDRHLVCHYCGYTQPAVRRCPECGSPYIAGFRIGTERVEENVRELFPGTRVLRMDADTTAQKHSHEQILSRFADGEADILIGTQMIVKGHDFSGVTLVGVLMADLSLHAGDYRAAERTFQLLTQAAGRAGRGERPGEVVIQTYDPGNYAVRYAAKHDYEGFYREEMGYRRLLGYPPVCHMLAVQVQGEDADAALAMAGEIRAAAEREREESGGADAVLLGPSEAALARARDLYRYVVYIKHPKYDTLVRYKDRIESRLGTGGEGGNVTCAPRGRACQIQFDFDPMNPF